MIRNPRVGDLVTVPGAALDLDARRPATIVEVGLWPPPHAPYTRVAVRLDDTGTLHQYRPAELRRRA